MSDFLGRFCHPDFVRDRDLNPLQWSGVVWLGVPRPR